MAPMYSASRGDRAGQNPQNSPTNDTSKLKKEIYVSLAESCTGGLISSNIISVANASKVIKYCLVTYNNESKHKFLKVPLNILQKYGAVSVQCCLSMVNNLSKISNSHINISITGIAGPKGGTRKKPVGLVFIGLKFKKQTFIKKYLFKNKTRSNFQKITVNTALKTILSIIK